MNREGSFNMPWDEPFFGGGEDLFDLQNRVEGLFYLERGYTFSSNVLGYFIVNIENILALHTIPN